MDGERFDTIAKSVADGRVARRPALRLLAGSLAAGLFALAGLDDLEARKNGGKKRGGKKRHNKNKKRTKPNPGGTDQCGAGLTRCGDTCVDLKTDPNHCGACANDCDGGACHHGACACDGNTCPDGCICFLTVDGPGGKYCQSGVATKTCASSAECPLGSVCLANIDGQDVCGTPCCRPTCGSRVCGDNGCGGTCGDCLNGQTCTEEGTCACPGGTKVCNGACVDNSFCCGQQDCPNPGQICPFPGQYRCCTGLLNACTVEFQWQCCSGVCGTTGLVEGTCCVPAGEPCAGRACCNGNAACRSTPNGAVCS